MIKTCQTPGCNKVFSTRDLDQKLCVKCIEAEDNAFVVIKEYLQENPGAPITQIHDATQIELDVIDRLLQSGRLDLVCAQSCTRCKKPIANGKLVCDDCTNAMKEELNSALLGLKSTEAKPAPPPISVRKADDGKSYGLGRR